MILRGQGDAVPGCGQRGAERRAVRVAAVNRVGGVEHRGAQELVDRHQPSRPG
jgi:hypothetical protein